MKRDVALVAAVRTPIGRFGGGLAGVPAVDLAVAAVRAALERSGLDPGQVDSLILGLARGAGCGPNPARQVAVRAGLPVAVPAYTVNQACASGLAAILQGASQIRAGEARVVVAAGAESMSRVPYLLEEVRWGTRSGHRRLVDGMYRDGFLCPLAGMTMGETAEKLARRYGISRQEQDAWALRSQKLCAQAWEEGRFSAEIVPVAGVERDEHPRPQTTLEALARLPGAFSPDGTVTAGNSSGICDGASAVVLAEASLAGSSPLGWWVGGVAAGVEPEWMGLGPVAALRRWFQRHPGDLDQFDLIELNEAFAAQVLACHRELGLPLERVNVLGGAIALGHPIGCSGNRIVVTLLHEMARRGARRGLATLCVSGGQGMLGIVER